MKITTTGLSILELKQKYPKLLSKQDWYKKEAFANEKPDAGEYEFDFTSRHCGSTYEEHKETMKKGFEFPHPAVLLEALCIHFTETGEKLMPDWCSRTSSLDSGGDRVYVGDSDSDRLYVYSYWYDDRSSSLGVSASRKITKGFEPLDSDLTLESLNSRLEKIESLFNQKLIA